MFGFDLDADCVHRCLPASAPAASPMHFSSSEPVAGEKRRREALETSRAIRSAAWRRQGIARPGQRRPKRRKSVQDSLKEIEAKQPATATCAEACHCDCS